MKEKIIAIIQARIGSTRLPGKVLLPLAGKSVLEHVIRRVQRSKNVSEVVVATSVGSADVAIAGMCKELSVRVFRGREQDVLDRFYQASVPLNPDHVVRVTADCPMIDPQVIDTVIARHFEGKADYTTNTIQPTYPDGEDIEIFTALALEKAWRFAKLPSEREHVTPYMRNNPQLFKLSNVAYATDLSGKRWTIDEERDYLFLQEIFNALYPVNNFFGMDDIVSFLKKNPRIEEINSGITRNDGYRKSLKNDRTSANG
ncbi:MAG: glycosyltransferase family protein [Candidatus Omnitrophica bacterium]|nr:glycosyltransferase family protein [Candidatus Omnitrophota bacterium]MBU1808946.1 glycosyltransferase family protein [Candidatus Omnitrophota bacterium]